MRPRIRRRGLPGWCAAGLRVGGRRGGPVPPDFRGVAGRALARGLAPAGVARVVAARADAERGDAERGDAERGDAERGLAERTAPAAGG
ncbi:hypothetical protein ACOCJ4_09540 [Knoellia sp. CPCC 206435]|uniref:hypothetical protein n=1 Tax=Knoellia terrae TaxID=3404797 RepID=UPI003B432324